VTDRAPTYPVVAEESLPAARHRTDRYASNRVEADHGRLKAPNGLFMLGLLAIGVALIAGVAMRIAAISGVVMLAMMWLAEVPFAQFTSAGEPTGSPNPFADSHYIYAVVLIVLAATYAGTTWDWAAPGPGSPSSTATAGPSNPPAHRQAATHKVTACCRIQHQP
jgi:uncharacterized membrane protein YphA (DoxX/SURF4 family)